MNSPVRFHEEAARRPSAGKDAASVAGVVKAAPVLLTGAALVAGRWWHLDGGPAGCDGLWMGLAVAGAFGAGIVLAARRAPKAAGTVLGVAGVLAYTAVCGFSRELPPVLLCAAPVVGLGYWLLGRFFWRAQKRAATAHQQQLELNGQRFEHEQTMAGMSFDRDRDVASTYAAAQVQIANSHATAALAVASIASDVRGHPLLAHSDELKSMLAGTGRATALPAPGRARRVVGSDEVFDYDRDAA